uniref:Interleukin-22 receptor subunit alpha-1 n=1 Tax=Jaculus jaculus TaxID=51337 RepID=A0A8C5KWS4_JACJA
MKTLLTFLTVGSLAAHVTEDTPGLLHHVKFQSQNFESILMWDSGPTSPPDTVYSVEYKTYGQRQWLAKAGCQQTTRKSCNLTMETGNLTELYYARVTALSPGGRSATKMTDRFSPLYHTTIKPPDVTCVPKVRSIQMMVHPMPTPILGEDGHQLTLEKIFQDLFYRLELQVNRTYQMHLEGTQREYEFVGLTPDTEFIGVTTISVPTWSKESAPYVCRVRTLPDRTWTYSFSGAVLFSMGFLVAVFCYLSYKYITKPPVPPNSLNVQRVLTFQPLRFIQEHVLIPVLDLSGSSSLAQPVHYSQVMVSGHREPPRAPRRHSLPEVHNLDQQDISILQPTNRPPQQTLSPQPYITKTGPEGASPSYAPQVAPEADTPFYTPQLVVKTQPSYAPQIAPDSWPASYGVFMEGSGKEWGPETLSSSKHLRPKDQHQKEVSTGSCLPDELSLQGVSLAVGETPGASSLHLPLGLPTDRGPDLNTICSGDLGTPQYLKGPLPLLASVQIEGHPVSLPLHAPSLSNSPLDQEPSPWGLLDSLVCPKDEGPVSEAEAVCPGFGVSEAERPMELDSFFKGLALTVQWEP